MKPRIALACIVKDDTEAEMFERMLNSFMPYMDGLYIVVTGTSGKHAKIHKLVKKFKGTSISATPKTHPDMYHTRDDGTVIFANFALARNVSFEMVPKGDDWIAWADVDDILLNPKAVLKMAALARKRGKEAVLINYWYSVDVKDGEVIRVRVEHMKERLLKPGVFKWMSRLHEAIVPKDSAYHPKMSAYPTEDEDGNPIAWVHLTTHDRVMSALERNGEILLLQAEEEHYNDPKTVFHLAKIYFDMEEWDKSDKLLEQYIQASGWDEELANAYEYRGLIREKKKDLRGAVNHYLSAIAVYPKNHSIYQRLVDKYYKLGMDEFAKH